MASTDDYQLKLGAETFEEEREKSVHADAPCKQHQHQHQQPAPCQRRYQLRSRGKLPDHNHLPTKEPDGIAENPLEAHSLEAQSPKKDTPEKDSLEAHSLQVQSPEAESQTTINDLPHLVIYHIFDHFTIAERLQLSRVSKAWRQYAEDSLQSATTLNVKELSTPVKDNKGKLLPENIVSAIRQMSANGSTSSLKTIDLADIFKYRRTVSCVAMWNLIARSCPGLEILNVHETEFKRACAERILSTLERLQVFEIADRPDMIGIWNRVFDPVVIEHAGCSLRSLTAPLNTAALKAVSLKFPHLQVLHVTLKEAEGLILNVRPLKQLALKELFIYGFYYPTTLVDQLFDEGIFDSPLSKTLEVLNIDCRRVRLTVLADALKRLVASCPKLREVGLGNCETLKVLHLFSSLEVICVNQLGFALQTDYDLRQFDSPLRNLKSLKITSFYYGDHPTDIVTILSSSPVLTSLEVTSLAAAPAGFGIFKMNDKFFREWTEKGRKCHRPWDAPLTWTLTCYRSSLSEFCETQARKASSLGLSWRFSHVELGSYRSGQSWDCPCAGPGKGKAFYLPINAMADEALRLG